jgi:subtilase-type serine protease
VTKTGTSTITLSGANSYTGHTIVSNGILRLASAGSIAGTPEIIVHAGATLDAADTAGLSVGPNQLLAGNGVVVGVVAVEGAVAPGLSIGRLTFSNDVALAGRTVMEINRDTTTNDVIQCGGTLVLGGELSIGNVGSTLQPGDQFQLLSAVGLSGGFDAVTPAVPGPGLAWATNSLAVSGILGVISTIPTMGTNLSYGVSGEELLLSWPASYEGWILQMQTNAVEVGLDMEAGAWMDIPGTDLVTGTNLPLDGTAETTFFRLRFP